MSPNIDTSSGAFQSEATANLVRTTLKLPLSGSRNNLTAGYGSQGVTGSYWSSSPVSTNGYSVLISSTQAYPLGSTYRAYGLSVRCLKN